MISSINGVSPRVSRSKRLVRGLASSQGKSVTVWPFDSSCESASKNQMRLEKRVTTSLISRRGLFATQLYATICVHINRASHVVSQRTMMDIGDHLRHQPLVSAIPGVVLCSEIPFSVRNLVLMQASQG